MSRRRQPADPGPVARVGEDGPSIEPGSLFRSFAEASENPVFLQDADGRYVLVNEAFAHSLGLSKEEIIGKSRAEILPAESEVKHPDGDLLAITSDGIVVAEERIGGRVYETRKFRVDLVDGRAGVGGFAVDVTSLRNAAAELAASEQRYRDIVGISSDWAWEMDREGRFTYMSENALASLGISASDALGHSPADIVDPGERQRALDAFREHLTTGEPFRDFETRFRRPDGSVGYVSVSGVPVRDENGAIVGLRGLTRDITARKEDEERLRESEERFRTLFQQAPLGYQSLDSEGRILDVNQAWLDLLGYERDEVAGRWFGELLAKEQVDRFRRGFPKLVQTGTAQQVEFLVRRKDGTHRLLSVAASVGRNPDGSFRQTHCILTDITEQMEARTALEISENRYRALFDHSLNAFALHEIVTDEDGTPVDFVFVAVNPAFCAMTGLAAEEAIGRRASDVMPGLTDELVERLARVAVTGAPERFESFNDGLGRYYDIAAFSPAPGTFAVVFSDITEQREADDRLAASEEKFRLAMEAAGLCIYDWDVPSGFTYYSPGYAAMVGCEPEQLEPSHAERDRRIHDDDREAVLGEFDRHLRGETGRVEIEYRLHTSDGRVIWALEQARAVQRDGDGRALRVVGTIKDITRSRATQERLQDTSARLRRTVTGAVAALGAAVESKDPYTVGHERRVAELACAIAVEIGLDEEAAEGLRLAAIMHDVGKIGVPAEILSKPGQLTDVEMTLVRQHAELGHSIIAGIEFDHPVADIVWQHHERLDGSGYPRGLRGGDVLLESCILAVADVVEAMVSHRPYRPGRPMGDALDEIERGAGLRYDAKVAAACVRLFREQGFSFSDTESGAARPTTPSSSPP